MRLLVVDNGKLGAARLGQALRELGHEAVISPDLAQALEAARRLAIDAVLVDLELAAMSGVEFAETLWLLARDIPVAFRQCSRDRDLIARAAEIGLLFPAQWTRADIERLVAALGGQGQRGLHRARPGDGMSLHPDGTVADGTVPGTGDGTVARPVDERVARRVDERVAKPVAKPVARPEEAFAGAAGTAPQSVAEHGAGDAWLLVPMRKIVRKIKVACRTWAQVERLCDQRDAGKDFLTLRGAHELEPEDRLTVALHLPGALTVTIAAQVTSTRCEGNERVHRIHLIGLTPERCARLRAMAASARRPGSHHQPVLPPAAASGGGIPDASAAGMDAPADERSMRHQVDSLAGKLRSPASSAEQSRTAPHTRPPRGRMETKQ